MNISANLEVIKENIKKAAARSGRDHHAIRVVAVTKYVEIDAMNQVIRAGITDIGENRIQDALRKLPFLQAPVTRHLIGTLQTNKVKDAVGEFDLIHSVDRPELVAEIARQTVRKNCRAEILIQVNISGETSKHGIPPDSLDSLLTLINQYETLKPTGLMTMAPLNATAEEARLIFRRLKCLLDAAACKFHYDAAWHYLSMGMSQDYEAAVEEGANLLRIGTAIFQ